MITRYKVPLLLVFPSLFLVGFIIFYPMGYAIFFSFHRSDFLNIGEWVGLKHFISLVQDPEGQNSILKSFIYTGGSMATCIPFGFLLAILLNQNIKFRSVFRTVIVLPWVVAEIISAYLWQWAVDPFYGSFTYLVSLLGFGRVNFFGSKLAMPTLILVNVWRSYPFVAILLLAGLQAIPGLLYEAAKIDGASSWQCFIHITLPLIAPTLMIVCILRSLVFFNMVTLVFILTQGGPGGATETLSMRLWREGFINFHFGIASGISVVIFFFNIVFSIAYILLLRRQI